GVAFRASMSIGAYCALRAPIFTIAAAILLALDGSSLRTGTSDGTPAIGPSSSPVITSVGLPDLTDALISCATKGLGTSLETYATAASAPVSRSSVASSNG